MLDFYGGTEAQVFEAFQKVNELYDQADERDTVNISLVPISHDQLEDWISNNVKPNWWQYITGSIRYSVTKMARE